MTTQKEMININRLVRIIQKQDRITKVRLIMDSGISISYYEKLKPFVEEIYPHKVRYDRLTKTWQVVTPENLVESDLDLR